jgi:DNA invertase Pin-like site-specific DNA recombinase
MIETKEVFGYVRVSGKGQVDGDGFARQEKAIEDFAASKGWTVKRIFYERAVSGTVESMDREAFSEMLNLCGGVLPSTIVVERADRLARDLIVGELLFRECQSRGVEVYSADSGEELVNAVADPTRILIRQVLGALAQWEKSSLVKKLRAARDRKRVETGRCEGERPWSETDPTGHALALVWIVGARDRGESFRQISKQLNLTPHKPRRGGKWSPSTIFNLYRDYKALQPNSL